MNESDRARTVCFSSTLRQLEVRGVEYETYLAGPGEWLVEFFGPDE